MPSRPTRPARWWARILALPLLVTILASGGTAAHATKNAETPTLLSADPTASCIVRASLDGAIVWVTVGTINPPTIDGWTLSWAMPNSQPIVALWNATLISHTNGTVVVQDAGWNSVIAPGAQPLIGYIANGIVPPSRFALNRMPCLT
ncbi:cellulose binding domain-containing protein [Micromonospora sp. NPDC048999]|uniref:cellulose binding domain-containing protein n=1 Tax=Micromonospora sp. NPDC048999 TaxID=3155391 RepID=UPI0033C57EA7